MGYYKNLDIELMCDGDTGYWGITPFKDHKPLPAKPDPTLQEGFRSKQYYINWLRSGTTPDEIDAFYFCPDNGDPDPTPLKGFSFIMPDCSEEN